MKYIMVVFLIPLMTGCLMDGKSTSERVLELQNELSKAKNRLVLEEKVNYEISKIAYDQEINGSFSFENPLLRKKRFDKIGRHVASDFADEVDSWISETEERERKQDERRWEEQKKKAEEAWKSLNKRSQGSREIASNLDKVSMSR